MRKFESMIIEVKGRYRKYVACMVEMKYAYRMLVVKPCRPAMANWWPAA
jgi:hypothetical protein